MPTPIHELLLSALDQVRPRYERLVLLAGPSGSAKTAALRALLAATGAPCVNVNLQVSRILMEVPPRERPLRVQHILDDLVEPGTTPVLLDNLEMLFDPALEVQPLGWLRRLSRGRPVVAAWSGILDQGHLIYAREGEPESRREPATDVITVAARPDA